MSDSMFCYLKRYNHYIFKINLYFYFNTNYYGFDEIMNVYGNDCSKSQEILDII